MSKTYLLENLRKLALRKHYTCHDAYYNCSKLTLGDDWEYIEDISKSCDCGADSHNIKVDEVFNSIIEKV